MTSTNPIVLIDGEKSMSDTSTIYSNNEKNGTIDLRRIQSGMLVKFNAKEVLGEWNCYRNQITEVYGVIEYIEDRCEVTG